MKSKKIVGVILAGGKGTRMDPFSARYPKPILPICNKPILQYQIECMKDLGIEEIIIVIGHLGFEIVKELGDEERFGMNIRYVDQGNTLGIAHALGCLESYFNSPFLLFLGDIFFITHDIHHMVDLFQDNVNGVLAAKMTADQEEIKKNFSIIMDESDCVKRVIEKPRYLSGNRMKGCGLYLFDLCIFDAIRRTPRTAMRDEYEITDAIQIMINDGFPVKVADVIEQDMNVSFPRDLLQCNLAQLKILGKDYLVGENVDLNPRVKLINSVVGDNVTIEHPITIENSVIFSDTIVRSHIHLSETIVTSDRIVDCRRL
jgi:NDP-sugar pyrophosphorylase family protein